MIAETKKRRIKKRPGGFFTFCKINAYGLECFGVVYHDSNFSEISTRCYQCNINSNQNLMSHTPKTFQSIHIYFTKSEEASRWIFTHLLFASSIILTFGGLFLHSLFGLLKVNINWLRVPKTESEIQK